MATGAPLPAAPPTPPPLPPAPLPLSTDPEAACGRLDIGDGWSSGGGPEEPGGPGSSAMRPSHTRAWLSLSLRCAPLFSSARAPARQGVTWPLSWSLKGGEERVAEEARGASSMTT